MVLNTGSQDDAVYHAAAAINSRCLAKTRTFGKVCFLPSGGKQRLAGLRPSIDELLPILNGIATGIVSALVRAGLAP